MFPLRDEDYITSTHRGHGHCIQRCSPDKPRLSRWVLQAIVKAVQAPCILPTLQKVIWGKCCSRRRNSIAVGAALAAKLRVRSGCCFFFGDGASNQGIFHESLNLAAVWKLPFSLSAKTTVSVYLCPPGNQQQLKI